MNLPKTDRIRLTNFANQLRSELGIHSTEPVSIHHLLRKKNILASFQPLSNGFEGMAVKLSGKGNEAKCFVLINTNSIYCRQRFTACHEAYHLLFQEDFTVSYDLDDLSSGRDGEEYKADFFARCLLLPADGLWQLIPDSEYKKDSVSLATILRIEQTYRCSRSCLLLQLKEMGVISEVSFDRYQHNVIRSAAEYGFDISLYKPTQNKELVGDYNVKARKLYDEGKISQAKYFSLLYDMGIDLEKEFGNGDEQGHID